MTPDPILLLIADRNVMCTQLLAESLGRDPRFDVAPIAPAPKILSLLPLRKPAVAVISAELDSGPTKGMHLARSVRARTRDVSIVMLLEFLEREKVVASFRSGAKGVYCRTEPLSELHSCIERVSQGRIWADQKEAEYLLEAIQSAPTCDGLGELNSLSKREVAVAEFAAQGLSNKQIALQLGLSEHTVKNHLFRIFEKLNVANRIELLFLMVKGRNAQYGELAQFFWGEGFNESAVVAAAEQGFLPAQFMLGMAHLEGRRAERDDRAAYRWLRVAELNSARVLEQSRSEISELRSRIPSAEIAELEQRVFREAQEPQRAGDRKAPREVERGAADTSKIAC